MRRRRGLRNKAWHHLLERRYDGRATAQQGNGGAKGPSCQGNGWGMAGMDHQRIISVLLRAEKAPHNVCLEFYTMVSSPDFQQAPLSGHGSCVVWNR